LPQCYRVCNQIEQTMRSSQFSAMLSFASWSIICSLVWQTQSLDHQTRQCEKTHLSLLFVPCC
jgi:hypothetical protein